MTLHDQFPRVGLVRLKQILAPAGPIPVSASTWWDGVKNGYFPKPKKLGRGTTVWNAADIWHLIEHGPEDDGA